VGDRRIEAITSAFQADDESSILSGRSKKEGQLRERLKMGEYSYGVPNLYAYSGNYVCRVGNFCSIAGDVAIILGGEHKIDTVSTYPFIETSVLTEACGARGNVDESDDVIIENDVWIGHRVTIVGGSYISNGAVIGAGAVVAGYVPPYAVMVGNPADILRYRFPKDQIESLLKIKWWDWGYDKLVEYGHMLTDTDIDAFIESQLGR
jgi:acetyltransferase-like isoleucine patch superfamily enzyme